MNDNNEADEKKSHLIEEDSIDSFLHKLLTYEESLYGRYFSNISGWLTFRVKFIIVFDLNKYGHHKPLVKIE